MEDPVVEQSAPKSVSQKLTECWNARASLWVGLIVLVLGVLGQILLFVLPGQFFVQSELGEVFYDRYELLTSLRVIAEAATYLGVVWVGVFLARWGIGKKNS